MANSKIKDHWTGSDKTCFQKESPSHSLTKFGRVEIVRLHVVERLGPLSIAVRLGLSHNVVQEVLYKQAGRERDFSENDWHGHNFFAD